MKSSAYETEGGPLYAQTLRRPQMNFKNQFISKSTNFHVIRHLAALGVILNHSYILFSGHKLGQPLRGTYGISIGDIALDFFLFVSGYFIALSVQSRNHFGSFVLIRSARLLPALIVSLIVGCFALVPLFGGMTFHEIISSTGTYSYIINNAMMFPGMRFNLPGGAFMTNPFRGSINGAIWTLAVEARLILGIGIMWWILRGFKNRRVIISVIALAGGLGCLGMASYLRIAGEYVHPSWRLHWMFLLGVWICMFPYSFPMMKKRHIAATALLFGFGAFLGKDLFPLVWPLLSPLVISALCFAPIGIIREFPREIDYSYGLFVYAFPVQQSLVAAHAINSPLQLFAGTISIVLVMASFSWHFIEKPVSRFAKDAVKHWSSTHTPLPNTEVGETGT